VLRRMVTGLGLSVVRGAAIAGLLGAAATVILVAPPARAQTTVPPGTQPVISNPDIADSCGTNVTLVLDASGSIQSSNAVDDVRDAGEAFLDALADTGSTARVLQFASISEQLAPQVEVTAASLQTGGAFRTAINEYYNPKPPRPPGVSIRSYDGSGDPQSPGNWNSANNSNQYTNWDQSLDQAGETQTLPTELVVYITDGDPTAYDFDQLGDPFDAGPPPDVGVNTYRGGARTTTLDRAVQEANQLKTAGARMLAVGVGAALGNPTSRANLEQIAGPQVVTDGTIGGINSINEVDVALVSNFDALAQFLRSVVNELCSPSLSIRKLAQSSDSADYLPAPAWDITVTPTVASGGAYRWILPDTDPDAAVLARCGNPTNPNDGAPRTCATDSTGLANFQWEPNPEDAATSAAVSEALRPGYVPGKDGSDWRCTLKDEQGNERIEEGELTDLGSDDWGFSLAVDPQEIITCNVYNSFVYNSAIALEKKDEPAQVRGDLGGTDSSVVSTFTVTNPGNAALSNVKLTDDKCTPAYVSGDIGGDGILDNDPAETWVYTCTRVLSSSPGTSPVSITNNARVTAVDPAGTARSAIASATVKVFAPAISLTKSASVSTVDLNTATPVTYTYVATNTGNMTLTDVVVKDDIGPSTCLSVNPVPPTTPPIAMTPGASQQFTCTRSLNASNTDPIVNTADVIGTPQFPPLTPPEVSGPVGPPVTAQAQAVVDVIDAELILTKTVDKPVILPGGTVTYTYTVTNPGNVGLQRPGGFGTPPNRDGWIVDSAPPGNECGPLIYDSGDDGGPFVLDPLETWTYKCSIALPGVPSRVVNTATVVAEPVGGGDPLTRRAQAVVEIRQPLMTLEKVAVRPVVLDDYSLIGTIPPATPPRPIAGPDATVISPAVYVFTVGNEGNLPIRDVTVTDTFPSSTGTTVCIPAPVRVGGIIVGDMPPLDILDPGEAWEYDCVVRLTKADDNDGGPGIVNAPSGVTNEATAAGTAFLVTGPQTEETTPVSAGPSSTQVLIISPIVDLTKTPCTGDPAGALTCRDDLVVRPGTDVTYRYEVRNLGDTTLAPVLVLDDRCDGIGYFGGDTNGDGLIEGGTTSAEVWEFRCTVEVNGPGPVVNEAGVLAVGPLGNLYQDLATASVRVFDPDISLVKTARESLVPSGTDVTYDFEVDNTGRSSLAADDVLAQVTLVDASDPAQPSCATPTYVSGDIGDDSGTPPADGKLQLTETWFYECTATLTADTTNIALVTGIGGTALDLPTLVGDLSAAFVGVFSPAIDVTKTANPTSVLESGDVTYTYEVRNTGDVPLADVKTRITDDKCSPVTYVSGDEDGDELLDTPNSIFEDSADEVWVFSCVTTIAMDTLNTVSVTGTPTDPVGVALCSGEEPVGLTAALIEPCDVTDTATANVVVLQRGTITIVKDADPNGSTPFSFTGTLGSFQLIDDGTVANTRTFTSLEPGTYTVTEGTIPPWSLDSITCVDPTNDTTVAVASGTATIALGSGENVICTFRNVGPAAVAPLPPDPELPSEPALPPNPELPVTGAAFGVPALLTGLALLGLGLLFSAASRRRRTA